MSHCQKKGNEVPVHLIDFSGLPWIPRQHLPHQVPASLRGWLFDSGSMTERLKRTFNNDFTVQVIRNGTFMPTLSEQQFIGTVSKMACIREVILVCDGKPRIFARSVLPLSSIVGSNRELLNLGSRPLGDFLFNHPSMRRGPFEVAELPVRQLNHYLNQNYTDETVWGRRSLFYLHEKPISVCEVFLPELEVFSG